MITEDKVKKIFKECSKNAKVDVPFIHKENFPYAFATLNNKIYYNYDNILLCPKLSYIYEAIYHEIGHIKYNGKYETLEEKIEEEAFAIEYSFKMLKKYHPQYVKESINRWRKYIKDKDWVAEWGFYVKAFNKFYKKYKKWGA